MVRLSVVVRLSVDFSEGISGGEKKSEMQKASGLEALRACLKL